MDRVTEAALSNNFEEPGSAYAEDAEAVTPDQGRITGRQAIVTYFADLSTAFPIAAFEVLLQHETADTAIETGEGQSIPATGRQIRVRECDVATVRDGVITNHRFYFDQMEFLSQLGLAEAT
jgi:ketosteroid isomerase-like protein